MATESKIFFSVLIACLLLLTLPAVRLTNSHAQSSPLLPGAPSFIDLGFSPNSLSPAQQGSPIFTVNDSLWIYSSFDQPLAVSLVSPSNASMRASLLPSDILMLYTFSESDLPGDWTLYFTLQNSTYYSVPLIFVELPANQVPVSLSEYSIQNGEINLGFAVNSAEIYDLEGCLTSGGANNTFSLADPASVGSGTISISLNSLNDSAIVTPTGTATAPFSFWFELDYSYSYSAAVINETVTRNVLVTRSSSVLFNGTSAEIASLPILGNLRPGRYLVRGYFDSSSGFSAAETQLLYLNGGNWFWLSSCNPFSIDGSTFSKEVNLVQSPGTWPNMLYFMFQYEGIEGYSILPLQINLARLDFLGQPGNVALSDFTYYLGNSSDLEASGIFSGSVFVIAKFFPLNLTVTPMLGSEALAPINVEVTSPFTDSQYFIPIGKLTIEVLNDTKPDVGAKVLVSNSQGVSLSSTIPAGGNTSFNLPAGLYNITVSKGGALEQGNATVDNGNDTIVTITVSSAQVPRSYLEILLVPLIIGLALNVWAWVVSPRRSRYLPR